MRRRAFPGASATLFLWLLTPWPLRAQSASLLERQVKATYLCKFAGFIEWPEGSFERSDSAMVIGALHDDALADTLEQTAASHNADGRAIVVKRLRRGDAPAGVHILFIGGGEAGALAELLAACRALPVLTVSDSAQIHALGSMINFVMAGQRVRFEVALKPAALARIRISARMLAAAVRVQPGAPA